MKKTKKMNYKGIKIKFIRCYTMGLEARVIGALKKLPDSVFESGAPIILMRPVLYKMTEPFTNWNSGAYCDYRKRKGKMVLKKVKVRVRDDVDIKIVVRALLHEFGHVIDLIDGELEKRPSQRMEFKQIILSEFDKAYVDRSGGKSIAYYRQPQEYFAEMVMEYIMDPERLKEAASNTYQYIELEINRLKTRKQIERSDKHG